MKNVASAPPRTDNGDVLRRLFNLATVLSLVLLVATVALWVRSYHVIDYVALGWRPTADSDLRYQLRPESSVGRLGFVIDARPDDPQSESTFTFGHVTEQVTPDGPVSYSSVWEQLGFYYSYEPALMPGGVGSLAVGFPHWVPAILAFLPVALFVRQLLRRDPDCDRCKSCGYNLTANVSGVCPECGSKVPA